MLSPRPGEWDARGARVTAVIGCDPLVLTYDGRPDAASNWHETTGSVVERDGTLQRLHGVRGVSPHSDGAFRYATVVPDDDGVPDDDVVPDADGLRWYVEMARPDGAHDLVTMTTPSPWVRR